MGPARTHPPYSHVSEKLPPAARIEGDIADTCAHGRRVMALDVPHQWPDPQHVLRVGVQRCSTSQLVSLSPLQRSRLALPLMRIVDLRASQSSK